MARNPLTEEQKKRNEEMRQIMKDQLAADAAQAGVVTQNLNLKPAEIIEPAVVTADRKPMEQPAVQAMTGSTLAPATAPAAATEPEVSPTAEPEPAVEPAPAPAEAPAETPATVPSTETPEQKQETVAAPATEPAPAAEATPAPAPAPLTPEEREAAMKQKQREQLTRDIAKSNRPEGLEPAQSLEGRVDPYVEATAAAVRAQNKGFADMLQSMRDEYERQRTEGEQQIKDEQNAAKWTGLTELAASLANMIGVGQGNAVSQTYRPHSQDWMQKADASIKEHRSRMENLRQRQRETELKMAQLRSEGGLAVMKAKQEADEKNAINAYRKAQAAYYEAQTEKQRQDAVIAMRKAEAEINAINALATQRISSADATTRNAATRASSAANQNANRDSRTENQNRNNDIRTQSGANQSAASAAASEARANAGGVQVNYPFSWGNIGSRPAAVPAPGRGVVAPARPAAPAAPISIADELRNR